MRFLCAVLLLAAAAPGTLARAEEEPGADAATARGLIDELGHEDRAVHDRARRALLSLDRKASRFAMEALSHPDPAVRRRARTIWDVPRGPGRSRTRRTTPRRAGRAR